MPGTQPGSSRKRTPAKLRRSPRRSSSSSPLIAVTPVDCSATPLTTPSTTPQITPSTTPSSTPSTTPSTTPSSSPSITPSSSPSTNNSPNNPMVKSPAAKVRRSGKPISRKAQKCIDKFIEEIDKLGVKGLKNQLNMTRRDDDTVQQYEAFISNEIKNRFKDVICIDSTRVILTMDVPPETDYIHASWVKMRDLSRVYIATQAPLPETVPDFWRMCFQEEAKAVIVLCQEEEGGRQQLPEYYWPQAEGETQQHGSVYVTNVKMMETEKTFVYQLRISVSDSNTEEPNGEELPPAITLELIHISEWPAKGVPVCSILRIFRRLPQRDLCVVQCTAGIGRSAVVISVDVIIQRLLKGIDVTPLQVVRELRTQRASSVQTTAQYLYITWIVLCYLKAKMPMKYQKVLVSFRTDLENSGLL